MRDPAQKSLAWAIGSSPAFYWVLILLMLVLGFSRTSGAAPKDNNSPARAADVPAPAGGAEDAAPEKTLARARHPRSLRLRKEPAQEQLGFDIAIEEREFGAALKRFHLKLREVKAGKGKARVAFFGASHTASDFITSALRAELQPRFGDGGHGFMQVAHPWPHYRHVGMKLESSKRYWGGTRVRWNTTSVDYYGLLGAYVEATAKGAFGKLTMPTTGLGSRATSYDLYYLKQPGGGDFELWVDGKNRGTVSTRHDEGARAGYATLELEDRTHTFEVKVKGGGPVRLFGTVLERNGPGVVVDTLGINGARNRYHLLWEESLYIEHLSRRNPDLVVLAYGTNESGDHTSMADYKNQLRRVMARVKKAAPNASCLFVGPSDRPIKLGKKHLIDRPRTAQVVAAQHQIAMEEGCGFFDLVAFQGGPLSMLEWQAHSPPYAADDFIHFTRRGYDRLAEALIGAMMEAYEVNTGEKLPPAPESENARGKPPAATRPATGSN